jgi:hypothetical protein
MVRSQRGNAWNLDIARGNLQKKNYWGISQNSPTLQGGKSLLTLFFLLEIKEGLNPTFNFLFIRKLISFLYKLIALRH